MVVVKVKHEESSDTYLTALASWRLIFAGECQYDLLGESSLGLYAVGAANLTTEIAIFGFCTNTKMAYVA